MSVISTPITELFGIKHPVLLAGVLYLVARDMTLTLPSAQGMNVAAGPELAAAVTNAGGLGVIGGIGYTPKILRQQVRVHIFSYLLTSVPIHARVPNVIADLTRRLKP